MRRVGGRGTVQVGLLGHSGGGACPNLPQRRPATGSAARRSAEYQRFSSRAPARSEPLQQIWTNGAAACPWEGRRESGGGSGGRPRAPRRALRTRKCSSNRHSRVQSAPLECKMHISTRKGPVGRAARVRAGRIPHSGRRIPETAPRARRTARSSRRRPSRRRPSHRLPSRHRPSRRRNPTRSRHAARRSDGLSPPMPDRAGFIILKG